EIDVLDERREHLLLGGQVAEIAHHEAVPEEAADASCGVAPGELGAGGELVVSVGVRASLLDLGHDLRPAGGERAGGALLPIELDEVGARLLHDTGAPAG